MTTAGAGLPESADFSVKPMGYEFGVTLSFIIEGENIIEVDEKSLKTEESGWSMGPFSKVNKERSLASFSVLKKSNFLGKENEAKVKGTVKVVTASKSQKKTAMLKNGGKAVDFNGLKVSLKINGENSFGSGILVVGDAAMIKSIKVEQGGETLKENGSSWSGDKRTYHFRDLKEKCKVTIEYWTDLEAKKIAFEKG